MSRPLPKESSPSWVAPPLPPEVTLRLQLITPLFGGGYEPREVDPVCIIRAPAIRGNLRFWWRALYGSQFGDSSTLFQAEADLWGAAATGDEDSVGKIRLLVTEVKAPTKIVTVKDFAPRGSPAQVGLQARYLLYPFQEQSGGTPPAEGYEGVEFTLKVVFTPDLPEEKRQQVRNALKAWIALGGIGARTRRGCGALTVKSQPEVWLPPADPEKRKRWFAELLPKAVQAKEARFSQLAGARMVCGNPTKSGVDVLYDLGTFWASFRKGHVGSKTYVPMEGARWSDYRRALLRFQSQPQSQQIRLAKPFFGLPIVYQRFPTARYHPTIQPAESGRMASPVILKPMALANGMVCPVCVVLCAPKPTHLCIIPPDRVVKLENPNDDDKVLRDLQARDPLDAVVKAAKLHWKGEVFVIGG